MNPSFLSQKQQGKRNSIAIIRQPGKEKEKEYKLCDKFRGVCDTLV